MNNSILIINKPKGISSFDVIRHLKRLGIKKAGHIGTLDPLAEGVLVVFTGNKTKEIPKYEKLSKEYTAEITFGLSTSTMDAEGDITAEKNSSELTESQLQTALKIFMGKIIQTPPMHSAVHHQGTRLYELARKGITVERKPREAEIFNLELTEFNSGTRATARLRVLCSSGTYIRVLAEDIGKAVGLPACLSALVRTKVGDFSIAEAIDLKNLRL